MAGSGEALCWVVVVVVDTVTCLYGLTTSSPSDATCSYESTRGATVWHPAHRTRLHHNNKVTGWMSGYMLIQESGRVRGTHGYPNHKVQVICQSQVAECVSRSLLQHATTCRSRVWVETAPCNPAAEAELNTVHLPFARVDGWRR